MAFLLDKGHLRTIIFVSKTEGKIVSYLFTLDYQLQPWGNVMQDLLMLHLDNLHHVTLPFSDRGKARNDNVLDASLSTNILDLPIILLWFWSRVFPFDSSLLWV